jgi:hypothetical protein
VFFQTLSPPKPGVGKLYIYKNKKSGLAVYFKLNVSNSVVYLHKNIAKWQKDSWHHIVCVYENPGTIALYVDGRLVKKSSFEKGWRWPRRFTVGAGGKGFGYKNGKTAVSKVTIYKRILTPEEIRTLAKNKAQDL